MIRTTILFLLFTAGLFLSSCSDKENRLELIEINGDLTQWGQVSLTFHTLDEPSEGNQILSSKKFLYGLFRHIDEETIIHGYFAGRKSSENISVSNNTWIINFTPHTYGVWTYVAVLTESLITSSEELEKYLKDENSSLVTGSFNINPDENQMYSNRPSGFIHYSKEGFLVRGEDDQRCILNCITVDSTSLDQFTRFTESHLKKFTDSIPEMEMMDLSSSDSSGKYPHILPGKINLSINGIKLSIQDILPNLISGEYTQGDLDKIQEAQFRIDKLNKLGAITILEILNFNSENLIMEDLDQKTMLYLRELIARFSHNTGLIWTINPNVKHDWKGQIIKDITKFIGDMDPYNHPILIECGSDDEYIETLSGYPYIEGIIMNNKMEEAIDRIFMAKNLSAQKGRKWVIIGTNSSSETDYNVSDIMWSGVLTGCSGFIWNLDRDSNNSLDFNTLYSGFSVMDGVNGIIPRYSFPYESELIIDSLRSGGYICIKSKNDSYFTYSSVSITTQIDSIGSGSYSIEWFNLNTDSIYTNTNTLIVNPNDNLVISSPETVVPESWLSIIQKVLE